MPVVPLGISHQRGRLPRRSRRSGTDCTFWADIVNRSRKILHQCHPRRACAISTVTRQTRITRLEISKMSSPETDTWGAISSIRCAEMIDRLCLDLKGALELACSATAVVSSDLESLSVCLRRRSCVVVIDCTLTYTLSHESYIMSFIINQKLTDSADIKPAVFAAKQSFTLVDCCTTTPQPQLQGPIAKRSSFE